jgi:hypothetical protein
MRTGPGWGTIGPMKLIGNRKRRGRAPGAWLEISGALSAASQMALLYPPGCDEWIRREFSGERGAFARPRRSTPAAPR